MEQISATFNEGDKIEIAQIENGFIITLKTSRKCSRLRATRIIDDLDEIPFDNHTKYYCAKDSETVSKIIAAMFEKI